MGRKTHYMIKPKNHSGSSKDKVQMRVPPMTLPLNFRQQVSPVMRKLSSPVVIIEEKLEVFARRGGLDMVIREEVHLSIEIEGRSTTPYRVPQ